LTLSFLSPGAFVAEGAGADETEAAGVAVVVAGVGVVAGAETGAGAGLFFPWTLSRSAMSSFIQDSLSRHLVRK